MLTFTGDISYILVTDEGTKVRFEVQAMSALTKGLFDWYAQANWQTVWRLYNSNGLKIWEDARQHSIMPFSQVDSAIDSFSFEVEKSGGSIYTFQLFGRIAGEMQFIAEQAVNISTNTSVPVPSPVPSPPTPAPVPIPPPEIPLPTPPIVDIPEIPDIPEITFPAIAGISAGVIIVGALVLFMVLRK